MMEKSPTILCLTLSMGYLHCAVGQVASPAGATPSPQATPVNVLGSLPASFTFVKKFTYLKPAAGEDPNAKLSDNEKQGIALMKERMGGHITRPIEIDAAETNQTRKDFIRLSDGSTQENWRYGSMYFQTQSAYPDYVGIGHNQVGNQNLGDTSDFGELSWITSQTFVNIQDWQGKKCDIHRSQDKTAYLDHATHLPLYFVSSDMKVAYSYGPPPETPLQLPEKVQKRMTQIQHAWSGAPDKQ